MKHSFKLSLLPDAIRIASFVLRIFVTYATAWCPSTAQRHLCDPNCDQPQHHTLLASLLRRPRRRSVQVRQHNWPTSHRLARTVLATPWRTHHRNHRRRTRRYIPSTDHRQFCPSWQKGHAISLLRERLDVSLAVLHGRGHRR